MNVCSVLLRARNFREIHQGNEKIEGKQKKGFVNIEKWLSVQDWKEAAEEMPEKIWMVTLGVWETSFRRGSKEGTIR